MRFQERCEDGSRDSPWTTMGLEGAAVALEVAEVEGVSAAEAAAGRISQRRQPCNARGNRSALSKTGCLGCIKTLLRGSAFGFGLVAFAQDGEYLTPSMDKAAGIVGRFVLKFKQHVNNINTFKYECIQDDHHNRYCKGFGLQALFYHQD